MSSDLWKIPVTGEAAAPLCCQMSRQELQALLERSDYGRNEAAFASYFRSAPTPGDPPLCNFCNRAIAEHTAASSSVPVAVAGAPVDAESLPIGMVHDGDVDRYTNKSGLVLAILAVSFFCIAAIMFITFGATGILKKAPATCISPCILLLMSLIFGPLAEKVEVCFDTAHREWSFIRQRYILRCVSERHGGSFDDIVRIEMNCDSCLGAESGVYQIGLRLRSEEFIKLQVVQGAMLATTEQAWKLYVETHCRRPLH